MGAPLPSRHVALSPPSFKAIHNRVTLFFSPLKEIFLSNHQDFLLYPNFFCTRLYSISLLYIPVINIFLLKSNLPTHSPAPLPLPSLSGGRQGSGRGAVAVPRRRVVAWPRDPRWPGSARRVAVAPSEAEAWRTAAGPRAPRARKLRAHGGRAHGGEAEVA